MYNFEIEAVLAAFPKTDKGNGEGVVPIAAVKNLETYLRCTTDYRDTVEAKLETFYALWASDGHASDCATHNEPAEPNGPCDCQPSPWIAVSDRMPEEGQMVDLWIVPEDSLMYRSTDWRYNGSLPSDATHWTPAPPSSPSTD